ncbi:biotin holocarboxylase synthetase [Perkinsus olseni]|uniref:Biotin holocarboxylase synthetase n=1 Tax=Perkinsus olseni TaxID=32597 RepID=A0A7J6MFF8_PEROL|nr:biotin holocarboxylase synthetase [Perkinsus olseni]KAF4675855.1 biotin holocarboxylase synthetase [Perkinsus olseni]
MPISFSCVFDEGGPLEVVGPRELAFHTGPAVGPHLATYGYNSNSGARAAELTDSGSGDAALPHGPIYAYFNGGACFPESQFPVGCRSEVLYRYASSGEPAILRCPVGSGKAILSGVHFEVMPEDLAELHDTDLSEHEVCELMFRTEKNLKILGSSSMPLQMPLIAAARVASASEEGDAHFLAISPREIELGISCSPHSAFVAFMWSLGVRAARLHNIVSNTAIAVRAPTTAPQPLAIFAFETNKKFRRWKFMRMKKKKYNKY